MNTITLKSTRWYRSENNVIAGVCGAVARNFGVETWIVRVVWLLTVLAFGTGVLAYFLAAVAMPREDRANLAYDEKVLGVCSRLARHFNIDVVWIRLIALLVLLSSFGASVLVYVAAHFLLPEQFGQEDPRMISGSH